MPTPSTLSVKHHSTCAVPSLRGHDWDVVTASHTSTHTPIKQGSLKNHNNNNNESHELTGPTGVIMMPIVYEPK